MGLIGHYKGILRHLTSGIGLESAGGAGEPDLSNAGIHARVEFTKAELYRIVKGVLEDDSLYEVADQIARQSDEALRVLRDGAEQRLVERPELVEGLEAIVRTDGSRPSFLIRNGKVDRSGAAERLGLKRTPRCIPRCKDSGSLQMHIADERHVIAAGTSHRRLCFGARPHDAFLRTTGQLRSKSSASRFTLQSGRATRAVLADIKDCPLKEEL
jgi:hypothetical protein